MLETIGTIMIVRIRIAANMFEPTVGFVLKIGIQPNVPWIAGPESPGDERPEHEDPPEPEDDARDRRQKLDERRHDVADPGGRELAEEEGDGQRDGRREKQRPQRRDQRPEDERLGAEERVALVPPGLGRQEVQAELLHRGPGLDEDLPRDERQKDDAGERGRARDHVEDRVSGMEAAPPLKGGGAGCSFLRD